MNKLILLSSLIFVISCSSQRSEYDDSNIQPANIGCISPKESLERKNELENQISSQVKFLGEPEDFNSIKNKLSEYKIPALSLAVINQGNIAWADIYQHAHSSDQQNLDCTSLFQTASLSKPVTFLAAVRMHFAGEIDLGKNIQEYLKDFVIPAGKQTTDNPVTFRNIFSHTSGINPVGYQGYTTDLVLPSDIDILKGATGVNSPAIAVVSSPNETMAYSGGAYTLAELALQDVYSDEFSNIMKKWILAPIGMKYSEFTQPLPATKVTHVAKGHTQSGDVVDGGWRNHPEQAAAGLWSNSIDMAKFLIEIYKGYQGKSTLFSQSEINSLLSHERNGSVYGFRMERSADSISLTHYGGNVGYRSGMTIDLISGNGLVYLTNSDNGGALGDELFLSAANVYNWKNFKQTEVHRKQVNADVLRELSGEYRWNGQKDLSIKFNEDSKLISLYFPNGDECKLTPIVGDELEFIHPNTGVKVTFLKTDGIQSFRLYGQVAIKSNSQ